MLPSYSNLINLQSYLKKYPKNDQPAAFEYLVASAFSQIFYLPFQSKDNEDDTENYRVIWYGSVNRKSKTISKSLPGPDSVCFAYGFHVLNESTLRKNSDQWRKEFVEILKHYDKFLKEKKADKKDVYIAFVFPKLHQDTYTGFQQKAKEGYKIVLLETAYLAKIWDITKKVPTIMHVNIRMLFNDIVKVLSEATSLIKFRDGVKQHILDRQENVCKEGKITFIGVKSYKALHKAVYQKGRKNLSTGEILKRLSRDPKVQEYFKFIKDKFLSNYIEQSLVDQGFGVVVGKTTEDELLFEPVNSADFKGRSLRLIKAVEEING